MMRRRHVFLTIALISALTPVALAPAAATATTRVAAAPHISAGWRAVPAAARAPIRARLASEQVSTSGKSLHVALTANNGHAGDSFGSAVSVSGSTIVVGAPCRKVDHHACKGAVYVFVKPASGWRHVRQVAEFTVGGGEADDALGAAVGVSGNTIVAGAPYVTNGTNKQEGAAYVFVKPASGWGALHHPTARLIPVDRASGDTVGAAVAISGNTIVVGAPGHDVGEHAQQGAAYVFVKPASGWGIHNRQTAELSATGGSAFDRLGTSVSISGNTVVAGAPYRKIGSHAAQGAAYVFVKSSTGWSHTTSSTELVARGGATKNYFGDSVAVSGDTVAVGAPYKKVGTRVHQGAGYVYVKPGGGWSGKRTQSATLTVMPGVSNAYFGGAIATSGRQVIGTGYGLASVFRRPGHGWSGTRHQRSQITGEDPAVDFIGSAVATSGKSIVAGAPAQTVGSHFAQGAVYLFRP